ncbi:hypothetical protein ABB07_09840 [Streptomyces incarnatus]|uniref:Uncharacterized protein n=1 Tax=Streptomyces incarnatus TaxID=665007 RepID=A0ABM5TH65_9ACTN|nr:hypothetical protein ABB07_09840 [Streptomyces incarnatus]
MPRARAPLRPAAVPRRPPAPYPAPAPRLRPAPVVPAPRGRRRRCSAHRVTCLRPSRASPVRPLPPPRRPPRRSS